MSNNYTAVQNLFSCTSLFLNVLIALAYFLLYKEKHRICFYETNADE